MQNPWQLAILVSIAPAAFALGGIFFTQYHTSKREYNRWLKDRFLSAAVDYFSAGQAHETKEYGKFLEERRRSRESIKVVVSRMAADRPWASYVRYAVKANDVHIRMLILTPPEIEPQLRESFDKWNEWLHFFSSSPSSDMPDARYEELFNTRRDAMISSKQELSRQVHQYFHGPKVFKT